MTRDRSRIIATLSPAESFMWFVRYGALELTRSQHRDVMERLDLLDAELVKHTPEVKRDRTVKS